MKNLTIFTAILLATTTTFAQVPNYVPTNGLVAWWPFNGNANDESGNGNNGTVNGATLTNDRFGNSNKSYFFDGLSNRIAINLNSINSTFPASTESTSSIWIKSSDLNGPLISMQGFDGIEYDFHIGTLADIVQNPGYYGILVRDNCCGTGNNAFASNCIDNNWHMLTIVRLTDGSLKFYKDAVFEFLSGGGQNGVLTFNPNYMTLGANYSWVVGSQNGCMSCNSIDQQHFNGDLDDVGIWNRALTDCEIKNLYNGGVPNSSQTQTALDTYTWPVNNQTYTQSGTYSDTLVNAAGCDSIVTLNLTLSYTGINELNPSQLVVSPNPTKDNFSINGLELLGTITSLEIKDAAGKVVKVLDPTATNFSSVGLKAGVYFLAVTSNKTERVIKIIKE
jgi:hypothetical protein